LGVRPNLSAQASEEEEVLWVFFGKLQKYVDKYFGLLFAIVKVK
jgi:hypothetical protein